VSSVICIYKSTLLTEENIQPINDIIEKVNLYMAPFVHTGELIIHYSEGGNWKPLYCATLNGGPGKSCAIDKVNTLIAHPEADWGGSIWLDQLAIDEKKWYGSIRLKNCCDLEGSNWTGEVIIAFSDRKEWQDVFYIAAVTTVLEDALKMSFDLPKGILKDYVWGTALSICHELFKKTW